MCLHGGFIDEAKSHRQLTVRVPLVVFILYAPAVDVVVQTCQTLFDGDS